ncbi:DNA-binding LacI/PurR family transcriptional regulator [Rhizobium sp. PP-F2F-G20b]|nr:DNA-binding LacI/PurR family transcriptional regulator [Rhizobium sp. PP-F2F-G20b]
MAKKSYKSMDEFAGACGVSRPTLSKYFHDPSNVKEVTRKRIEAALKKSNFEPNLFARHLNRKRTRNIGVLVPTISDPFYVQVVTLIELELRARGFWPIQISSHTRPDLEEEAIRTLLALKVAGAIVAPLGAGSRASTLQRLTDTIPVVCFDSPASFDLPYVGNDNAQSVAAMVQYLCRSGEPPVFLEIPQVNENSGERQDSYRATMLKEGHEPLVIDCETPASWEFERLGFEQMQTILKRDGLPGRTLFCANDRFAFGAMAAAFAAGLKIGRGEGCDVRIAGHDDHPLSRYTCPPLTTMAQNATAIAATSVEILLRRIDDLDEGRPMQDDKVILEATLVMRESA